MLQTQMAEIHTWQEVMEYLGTRIVTEVRVLHGGRTATVHSVTPSPGGFVDIDFGWSHKVAVRPWDHVAVLL